jgi:hypothetical protein
VKGSRLHRWATAVLIVSISAVMYAVYARAPLPLTVVAVAAIALTAWWRSNQENAAWYAATLGLGVPQDFSAIRIAVADFFALPLIVDWIRRPPSLADLTGSSRLTLALIALLPLFAAATLIGYLHMGRLSGWALLNKDAGLILLIGTYLALCAYAVTTHALMRLVAAFVIGISVMNLLALAAFSLSWGGFANYVYLVDNARLYGWMGNPSIAGGMTLTAAMLEMALLHDPVTGRRYRMVRWANVWLLGATIALTLSRSTWAATALAAGCLSLLLIADRETRQRRQWGVPAMAVGWMVAASATLGYILTANLMGGSIAMGVDVAEQLRARLILQCEANPASELCSSVEVSTPAGATETGAEQGPAVESSPSFESTPSVGLSPPVEPSPSLAPDTSAVEAVPSVAQDALMNARGLDDRLAILTSAWRDYNTSWPTRLFGIGLGTFFASSAADFGVPLIIHNTFVWFLVELGPIGLLLLTLIWGQAASNLFAARRYQDYRRHVATGAIAALAGLTVFCLFNEGFYQRQLWIVLVIAARLGGVASPASSTARATATPAASGLAS